MSKTDDKVTIFISNVPRLEKKVTERFLKINNLKWKDVVIIFANMVLKRSWSDRIREGGGPPGFAAIDDNYFKYLDALVVSGKADADEVMRWKNLSFIERHNHKLVAVNRNDLKKIMEEIERGEPELPSHNGGTLSEEPVVKSTEKPRPKEVGDDAR